MSKAFIRSMFPDPGITNGLLFLNGTGREWGKAMQKSLALIHQK